MNNNSIIKNIADCKSMKVVWLVEVLTRTNSRNPKIVQRKITTYYRPKIEKEDVAMAAIKWQLGRYEQIHLILSKDKQPC